MCCVYDYEKEYKVLLARRPDDKQLQAWQRGVVLEDGMARFTDVRLFDGSGSNAWYHVVVMEGKNREVRRLWESQGVEVSRLKRVRYGCIFMPKSVATGH